MDNEQQEEMLVEDNEAIPNSSITTTVSLSDGILSHNALGGNPLNEEVNQVAIAEMQAPLGIGMQNLLQAYPPEEHEEEPEMEEHTLVVVQQAPQVE